MKKEDLKAGYLIQTRDEVLRMVMPNQNVIILIRSDGKYSQLNFYNDDLTYNPFNKAKDIVKVWGYSHYANTVLEFDITDRELLWERKEPLYFDARKSFTYRYISLDKINNFNIFKLHGLTKEKVRELRGIWDETIFTKEKPTPLQIIDGEVK